MGGANVHRGVTKSEWIEVALGVLSEGQDQTITVEDLAGRLGIAKSGFYWHFKNRDELLQELVGFWEKRIREILTTASIDSDESPQCRLLNATVKLKDQQMESFETATAQWARQNKEIAKAVKRVNRLLQDWFIQVIGELGISGEDAEMRTHLFVCSVYGQPYFRGTDKFLNSREMIESRISLLTS